MDMETRAFLENMSNNINTRFDSLDTKFEGLETKFEGLETKFEGLETKFEGLETKFEGLDTKFDGLSAQVKENTHMLKALEENAKVTRAEIEKIATDVVYMNGNIEALRKDVYNIEIITSNNWSDIIKLKAAR